MITLGTIRDMKLDDYDEVWFIMRSLRWLNSPKLFADPKVKHIPILSPQSKLFYSYRDDPNWGDLSFQMKYVPRFIDDIFSTPKNEKEFKDALNELYKLSKRGKNILLICSCADERNCHRSIIGGILLGGGVDVVSTTGNVEDYRKYFEIYQDRNLQIKAMRQAHISSITESDLKPECLPER